MDYQEKVKKAEEIAELILNGISEEECRNRLSQESFKSYEIDKILKSTENVIKAKYTDRIKAQMLDGTLESHLDDYDELSEEIFDEIQLDQIANIQSESKYKLIKRLKQGEDVEVIQDDLVNDYFPRDLFNKAVQKYEETKSETSNGRMIGMVTIVLGIILSIMSASFTEDGIILFYGLVVYGIWRLFKSFD